MIKTHDPSKFTCAPFKIGVLQELQWGRFRVRYQYHHHPTGMNYPSIAFGVLPGFYEWFIVQLPDPYVGWDFVRRLDPELEECVRAVLGKLGITHE